MADTFTAVLELTKPEVGASLDTWGTKLNDNFDDVDALFSAGPVLKVANGGTAATTAAGARTSLGLGTMATQNASAVAVTGGTITGVDYVRADGASPSLLLYNSSAGTDEKYAGWNASTGGVAFKTFTDAGAEGATPISINRSGTTVTSVAIAATALTFNGNAVYHAGTFTGPSSGSFTISLRAVSEVGTVLGTGTAYWRKFNNVVTLRIPPIFPSSTATAFYLTGLPADIQVGAIGAGASQYLPLGIVNGGTSAAGLAAIYEGFSYFTLAPAGEAWTATDSAKGVLHTCVTYQIAN